VQAKLTALNLPFMRENYQPLAHTAADKHWSHVNYFTELLSRTCKTPAARMNASDSG
jgi:hypothetical protein